MLFILFLNDYWKPKESYHSYCGFTVFDIWNYCWGNALSLFTIKGTAFLVSDLPILNFSSLGCLSFGCVSDLLTRTHSKWKHPSYSFSLWTLYFHWKWDNVSLFLRDYLQFVRSESSLKTKQNKTKKPKFKEITAKHLQWSGILFHPYTCIVTTFVEKLFLSEVEHYLCDHQLQYCYSYI